MNAMFKRIKKHATAVIHVAGRDFVVNVSITTEVEMSSPHVSFQIQLNVPMTVVQRILFRRIREKRDSYNHYFFKGIHFFHLFKRKARRESKNEKSLFIRYEKIIK